MNMDVDNSWTTDERNLLSLWKNEAVIRANEHHRMTRINRICNRVCGIFEAVLTAIATTIVFLTIPGDSSPICAGKSTYAQFVLLLAGIATALVLCAIGIDNVFNFSRMMEKHARAKARLSGYVRYIDATLRIDPLTREGAAHTLNLAMRRLNNITEEFPFVRIETISAPSPHMESVVKMEMKSPGAEAEYGYATDELSSALVASYASSNLGTTFDGSPAFMTNSSSIPSPLETTFKSTGGYGSTPNRNQSFCQNPNLDQTSKDCAAITDDIL